jgi:hypothetical protein
VTIDIAVAGWRFYLNLAKPEPPAPQQDSPPTQLGQPMQVHPGYVGYYQTRAADVTARNDQDFSKESKEK